MFRALFAVGMIVSSLGVTALPTKASPDAPPDAGIEQTQAGPAYIDNGQWIMPAAPGQTESPQVLSIGPDDFGYTLNDTAPFTWLGATSGISIPFGWQTITGPVSLPFAFKFYENTYNQVYVSPFGNLRFSSAGANVPAYAFPSPKTPNNVIAPY